MVHSLSRFRFTRQAATTCLPSSYLCCDYLSPSCGSFPSCLKPTLQAATTCLPASYLCCVYLSPSCGSFPVSLQAHTPSSDYSSTLLISYHYYWLEKHLKFIFNLMCACGHQMHQQQAVHVPFLSLWCWLCYSQLAFAF